MKLIPEDIKVLSEGQQIEKAILRDYENLQEFAAAIGMNYQTVKKYLRQENGGSGRFKQIMIQSLKISYFEIVRSKQQQVMRLVDQVSKNIKEYKNDTDLEMLEKLKDRCIELKLTTELAKMYRAIGMYHFNRNETYSAISFLQVAIDMVGQEKEKHLLAVYCSELGLVYFVKCDYEKAKSLYEEVQRQINSGVQLERKELFLHYYRYGLYFGNKQDFESAKFLLNKALKNADENKDICMAIMNIGIIYEKQGDFRETLKYLRKALKMINKDDYTSISILHNNMAELYKLLGQYDKALSFVNKSLDYCHQACTDVKDVQRLFLQFTTYTEIKILMGEPWDALHKLMDILSQVNDFALYKSFIVDAIKSLAFIDNEDRSILDSLEDIVIKLISDAAQENEIYRKELINCLGNICYRKRKF